MARLHTRLFRIADELVSLREEETRVSAELDYHRSINDDAQRDAVVSGANMDRLEASSTAKDVERFVKRLEQIAARRRKLEAKRAALLRRL
jgi:hypothetical protein